MASLWLLSMSTCSYFPPVWLRETSLCYCYFLFAFLEQALSEWRQMSHSGCLVLYILVLPISEICVLNIPFLKYMYMSIFAIILDWETFFFYFLIVFLNYQALPQQRSIVSFLWSMSVLSIWPGYNRLLSCIINFYQCCLGPYFVTIFTQGNISLLFPDSFPESIFSIIFTKGNSLFCCLFASLHENEKVLPKCCYFS